MTRQEAEAFVAWFQAAEEAAKPTDDGVAPAEAAVQSVEILRPAAELVQAFFFRRDGEDVAVDLEKGTGEVARIRAVTVQRPTDVKLVQ